MKILSKLSINQTFSKSLFSSILLTLIFTLFVSFFYLVSPSKGDVNISIRIFVVLFYASLFFLMMKTGKVSTYRSIFFITFAVLFVISFIANLYETRGSMSLSRASIASLEVPFCHIVIPQTIITAILHKTIIFPGRMLGGAATIASMAGIWFLTTFTVGRGWCSWICFFGGLDEGFSKIGGKKRWNLDKLKTMRYFPFAFLAFIALASLVTSSAVYCAWFCPFKTTTEFAQVVNLRSFIAAVIFIGLFATLVVAFPVLTKKRTQCGLFCPFGAFQSIFNKTTLFRIRIDKDKCTGCKKCIAECPTFSITENTIENGKTALTCTLCGKCVDNCPNNAIDFSIKGISFTQKDNNFKNNKYDNGLKIFLKSRLNEILDARVFLILTAFLFGTIIASGFIPSSIQRLINLVSNGTLLLK